MSKHIEKILFNTSSNGEDDNQVYLEQYKIYIESININAGRRHSANSFFLTLHTFLLTTLSGFVAFTQEFSVHIGWIIIPSIAGVIFCISWRRLVLSYKQLSKGKFEILHLLESKLQVRLFEAEWEVLHQGDGTVYKPFTEIESRTPVVFAIIYGFLIMFGLLSIF